MVIGAKLAPQSQLPFTGKLAARPVTLATTRHSRTGALRIPPPYTDSSSGFAHPLGGCHESRDRTYRDLHRGVSSRHSGQLSRFCRSRTAILHNHASYTCKVRFD